MGLATLNVWVHDKVDPCKISDDFWLITVTYCNGNVVEWCGHTYWVDLEGGTVSCQNGEASARQGREVCSRLRRAPQGHAGDRAGSRFRPPAAKVGGDTAEESTEAGRLKSQAVGGQRN